MTALSTVLGLADSVMECLNRDRRRALVVILPAVLLFHLWAAAGLIRHSNQDPRASDQGAELWLAETSRDDVWPQRTDGVRHPLWSWTVRHLFTQDQVAFFTRGKWLNTMICLVFLTGLGLAASRWLDALATANLLLLCSLGILLVRGTYFQPEPLYYIFFFLAAVLGWTLLGDSPWWHWPVFGGLCGSAYLAKPSLAPFLLVFAVALGVRALGLVFRRESFSLLLMMGGGLTAAAIFAVMLLPLGLFSHQHFGKPLFNYPQYWMWMDDFETEAWPWQDRYPGRLQLETLSPEETPGPRWYFTRHSVQEAGQRLVSGVREVSIRFFFPESKLKASAWFGRSSPKKWEQPLAHRGVFLIALGAMTLTFAVFWRGSEPLLRGEPWVLSRAIYVTGIPVLYALLYGWYWPIGRGDRFMGSLWIPVVYFLCRSAAFLRQRHPAVGKNRVYLTVHAAILLIVLLQMGALVALFSQGQFPTTRN